MSECFLTSPFIGFTGTRIGLSGRQLKDLEYELKFLWESGARVLRHGLCIGGDEEAHDIATHIGYATWGHPGFLIGHPMRSTRKTTWIEPIRPPIMRNHIIVDHSCFMLAAPQTREEVRRSGTWATIRYFRAQRVPHVLIKP